MLDDLPQRHTGVLQRFKDKNVCSSFTSSNYVNSVSEKQCLDSSFTFFQLKFVHVLCCCWVVLFYADWFCRNVTACMSSTVAQLLAPLPHCTSVLVSNTGRALLCRVLYVLCMHSLWEFRFVPPGSANAVPDTLAILNPKSFTLWFNKRLKSAILFMTVPNSVTCLTSRLSFLTVCMI